MSDRDLVLLSVPIVLIVVSVLLSSFVLVFYSFLAFVIVLSAVTAGRLSPAERGSANVLTMPGPDRSLGASTDEILAKGARGTRSLLSDSRSVLLLLSIVLLYLALALL